MIKIPDLTNHLMSTRSHTSCCKINLTLIFYSLWMEGMRRARARPVNHSGSSETPARHRRTETARQRQRHTHTRGSTHTLQSHECLIGRRRAGGRGRELSLRVTLNGGPRSFSGRETLALMELLQVNEDNTASCSSLRAAHTSRLTPGNTPAFCTHTSSAFFLWLIALFSSFPFLFV